MSQAPVRLSAAEHEAMTLQHGQPVYLLFVDLRGSLGDGFTPVVSRALRNLSTQFGVPGPAMQHWAIMIDGMVYEMARGEKKSLKIPFGRQKNSDFKWPKPTPFASWEVDRGIQRVSWRQFGFTKKSMAQITDIAERVFQQMAQYNAIDNNCQHFATRVYDELECGYNTGDGWAPMTSNFLPARLPTRALVAATQLTETTVLDILVPMVTILTLQ